MILMCVCVTGLHVDHVMENFCPGEKTQINTTYYFFFQMLTTQLADY